MGAKDLSDFVRLLEGRGELCRVPAEIDPALEIAAVTDRVCKSAGGGRALFFEKVRGRDFPVLTNLFGSARRTAWALGVEDVETLARRLAADLEPGEGPAEERLRRLVGTTAYRPDLSSLAPCREAAMVPPDLNRLPALRSWPLDGGPFLTLPLVFTRDPETGEGNCGMYRMQIFDGRSAALHWGPRSDAARHYRAHLRRKERMPVAVALGGDPALIYAAGAPLPAGVDEVAFAGWIREAPIPMIPCPGSDLSVPAGAEFVIEGYVEPGEERFEGPFGNHTGYYAPAEPSAVFHVTAITHRRRPLFPATVVGPPPMEDCWLARASARLFLPLLRLDVPEIVDCHLPLETIFHGCALVAVRKEAQGRGRQILRRLWQGGFLKSSRLLVLLGEEADVRNLPESFWRAVNRVDPSRDVILDGNRIGIDATALDPGPSVGPDAATRDLVERRWGEYGIE